MYKFDNKHVFVTLIQYSFKWEKYTVRKLFVFTEGCCSSSKDLTSGVHFYILLTMPKVKKDLEQLRVIVVQIKLM